MGGGDSWQRRTEVAASSSMGDETVVPRAQNCGFDIAKATQSQGYLLVGFSQGVCKMADDLGGYVERHWVSSVLCELWPKRRCAAGALASALRKASPATGKSRKGVNGGSADHTHP